jgi:hypothetical protein
MPITASYRPRIRGIYAPAGDQWVSSDEKKAFYCSWLPCSWLPEHKSRGHESSLELANDSGTPVEIPGATRVLSLYYYARWPERHNVPPGRDATRTYTTKPRFWVRCQRPGTIVFTLTCILIATNVTGRP